MNENEKNQVNQVSNFEAEWREMQICIKLLQKKCGKIVTCRKSDGTLKRYVEIKGGEK